MLRKKILHAGQPSDLSAESALTQLFEINVQLKKKRILIVEQKIF